MHLHYLFLLNLVLANNYAYAMVNKPVKKYFNKNDVDSANSLLLKLVQHVSEQNCKDSSVIAEELKTTLVGKHTSLFALRFSNNQTVLHAALDQERALDIIKIILSVAEKQATLFIQIQDNDSNTVLHLAARKGLATVIREIVSTIEPKDRKTVLGYKNIRGYTAYQIAKIYEKNEALALLKEYQEI